MSSGIAAFKRFFHWGPICALSVIKCVTITTLYFCTYGGFLNQLVFMLLSSLATFNYIMATVIGPGYLPKNWKPKNDTDTHFLQFCSICQGFKAPRSHHCRKCDRCVQKMDHHCPWINNCVGWSNHVYFTYFLGFAVLGSIQSSFILFSSFYQGIHRNWYIYHGQPHLATVQFGITSLILCIFSLGLAIGVIIAVGMLLYFQLKAIFKNRTGIEDWIIEKASYRRMFYEDIPPFVFPYDLGKWENFKQVMNLSCSPIGDGISWELKDGCNQYDLTVEQISQKVEKRARTRIYRVVKKATGSYIPLFSQGCRVCFSPPCTDEPRIKLSPGEVVKVTRWRKHWLFGERDENEIEVNEQKNGMSGERQILKKSEIRGWFPRRCVIEIIPNEANMVISESIDDSNKKKIKKLN